MMKDGYKKNTLIFFLQLKEWNFNFKKAHNLFYFPTWYDWWLIWDPVQCPNKYFKAYSDSNISGSSNNVCWLLFKTVQREGRIQTIVSLKIGRFFVGKHFKNYCSKIVRKKTSRRNFRWPSMKHVEIGLSDFEIL